MQQLKKLSVRGNSMCIPIDKGMLAAASLDDSAMFHITVRANGGLLIESANMECRSTKEVFDEVLNQNMGLIKKMADR